MAPGHAFQGHGGLSYTYVYVYTCRAPKNYNKYFINPAAARERAPGASYVKLKKIAHTQREI